jgi:DEAD/DEAH box helicase domain-containing protein
MTISTRPDLRGLNITVFDCEVKEVPGENGIGWRDYAKLGVSVACAFDFRTLEYRVYMDDNLPDLAEQLEQADMVVGFNTLGFDVPLLEGVLNQELRKDHHYDLLAHSRKALGKGAMPKGCKLDNHLLGTFGKDSMKTADGVQAPRWWKEGSYGRLISYCLDDVKREARLFKFAWDHGHVKTDTHGIHTLKERPQDIFARLTDARAHADAAGLTVMQPFKEEQARL